MRKLCAHMDGEFCALFIMQFVRAKRLLFRGSIGENQFDQSWIYFSKIYVPAVGSILVRADRSDSARTESFYLANLNQHWGEYPGDMDSS